MLEIFMYITTLFIYPAKMIIPLILTFLLQNYICENKSKYSLVIPGVAFVYFLFKAILLYPIILNNIDYYTILGTLFIIVSDISFFIVTLLQHKYFQRQRESATDFNKMKINDL